MLRFAYIFGAVAVLTCVSAGAQNRGGGGQGPGVGAMGSSSGMGAMGGGMNHGAYPGTPASGTAAAGTPSRIPNASPGSSSSGGLQLGLPGRWWDNKAFARSIGLNPVQQHHMDDVFMANRENLMSLQKGLQHEESQLRKLSHAQDGDENRIFQQIDRVTTARGELEKGYAHMLLMIRREMTAEQMGRLDAMLAQ